MARAGTLADDTARWLLDENLARSTFGAAVYRDPALLTDDIVEYYVPEVIAKARRLWQSSRVCCYE